MSLKHACFISYRRIEGNETNETFVRGVYKVLREEIDLRVGSGKVYIDEPEKGDEGPDPWANGQEARLTPGAKMPESLSRDLCESACLVVIFNADYFSRDSTWCTREFQAMLDLERRRHKLLPASEQDRGLLIIIVLRAMNKLPDDLKQKRFVCDFSSWMLHQGPIHLDSKAYGGLAEVAAYIEKRFDALKKLEKSHGNDPCACCDSYKMPSEEDALKWLDGLESKSGQTIPEEHADVFARL